MCTEPICKAHQALFMNQVPPTCIEKVAERNVMRRNKSAIMKSRCIPKYVGREKAIGCSAKALDKSIRAISFYYSLDLNADCELLRRSQIA